MNQPGGGTMNKPGGGARRGVVLTIKWLLAALVAVSLFSTFLFGDTLTRSWSRAHVDTDEVSVAKWGEQIPQHSSKRTDFQLLQASRISQDQVQSVNLRHTVNLSKSLDGPTEDVGTHLIADFLVGGSVILEHIAMVTANQRSTLEHVAQTSDQIRQQVTPASGSHLMNLDILYQKLMQLEQASLVVAGVSVRGSASAAKHHLPLVESAFQKLKVKVTYQRQYEFTGTRGDNPNNIVMCLNTTGRDDNCGIIDTSSLQPGSQRELKVNIIPELISVMTSRHFLCVQTDSGYQRTEAVRGQGHWYGGQLNCYSSSSKLPSNMAERCLTDWWGVWVLADWGRGATGQFKPCDWLWSLNSSQRSDEILLVPLPRELMTLDDMAPLVWQTEVLVTSLSPPRVYLHPTGLAWSRLEDIVDRKHPANTSLSILEQLFAEWDDNNIVRDHQNTEWGHQNTEWDHQNTEWDHQNTEWDHQNTEWNKNTESDNKNTESDNKNTKWDKTTTESVKNTEWDNQNTKWDNKNTEWDNKNTEWDKRTTARLARMKLQSVLLGVVRSVERYIAAAGPQTRLVQNGFQQLEILLVFDSSFQPIILEVSPKQFTKQLNSVSNYLLQQNILDDMAAMLVSTQSTCADLLWPLYDLGLIYIKDKMICDMQEVLCLTERDIIFLLNTRREQKASKNWIRLFPSTIGHCEIKDTFPNAAVNRGSVASTTTEAIVLLVERYYLCPVHRQQQSGLIPSVIRLKHPEKVSMSEGLSRQLLQTCDSDNSSLPYLDAIHTDPYIQLQPEFSPLTTDYSADVSYPTTLVHLAAVSSHCRAGVRLGDQAIGNNRWASFNLALGENTAQISVFSRDQPEAPTLNSYRITFHRKPAGQISGFDEVKADFPVCTLKQDCSLPLSPSLRCGLQAAVDVMTWTEILQQRSTLPQCGDQDTVSGEWMVPCHSCQNESSCYWKKAIWQSPGCQEGFLAASKFKDCLAGKRVLFIGDSTNRGILHYILQRVNGSLLEWDKTHSTHIYSDFNDGLTVFGFAYYPQFWRRPGVRPGLDTALSQLLNRTSQWPHRETVLVLGGVHWLAKHHLDILLETLKKDRANKWTMIIKGLGAGFHQPVHGVHQLSLKEQQQLFSHNQALLALARSLGFSVVDTFSMTMSRFRDFLQGRCSCHFHQVSPVPMSAVDQLRTAGTGDKPLARFHIQGDINAVYSEMVINRMCLRAAG